MYKYIKVFFIKRKSVVVYKLCPPNYYTKYLIFKPITSGIKEQVLLHYSIVRLVFVE